jgi:glycosyltransferase involved in cell wall biosynthesis
MKNLKILVDCHVFDQSLQGTTTYIKGLYLELLKDSSMTFYFVSHHYNLEEVFGIHPNVVYLKFKSKNKFYRLLIEFPKLIKKYKIDYAHFQYIVPPIKRCKYIVTLHDVLFLDYPGYFPLIYKISKRTLYKLSAKYSDVVLTVSEYSKQRIQHHFKINSVFITPNAVDPIFYEEYDKQKAQEIAKLKFDIKNYFLFVSRWEPRKNHHLLLKVFVEYKYYEKYNLVFVGDDAIENKEYNTYFNNLSDGIKSKIFKYQKVSFQDLVIIIRGASLSVYPSIAEGFGIPPLESLAANIPTICSNTTAMSDFQFFNDCLFNPLETEDLKNKIDIGLNDTKITQKKEAMKTMFNWKIASESFKKAIS